MDQVIAHLTDNAMAYGGLLVISLPVLYIFRQYTVPAFLWTLEVFIYFVIMHLVVHFFIIFAKWFRDETTPNNSWDMAREEVYWGTPLLEAWDRSQYNPGWVFYFEVVFIIAATIFVLKNRPIKTQKPLPPKPKKPGMGGTQYGRGSQPPQGRR